MDAYLNLYPDKHYSITLDKKGNGRLPQEVTDYISKLKAMKTDIMPSLYINQKGANNLYHFITRLYQTDKETYDMTYVVGPIFLNNKTHPDHLDYQIMVTGSSIVFLDEEDEITVAESPSQSINREVNEKINISVMPGPVSSSHLFFFDADTPYYASILNPRYHKSLLTTHEIPPYSFIDPSGIPLSSYSAEAYKSHRHTIYPHSYKLGVSIVGHKSTLLQALSCYHPRPVFANPNIIGTILLPLPLVFSLLSRILPSSD